MPPTSSAGSTTSASSRRSHIGVPATLQDLEAALGAARKAGEVPIMLGNKQQWPGLHLFYLVSNDLASDREINGIVFGDRSVQWTAAELCRKRPEAGAMERQGIPRGRSQQHVSG